MTLWMFCVPLIPVGVLTAGVVLSRRKTHLVLAQAMRHPAQVEQAWLAGPSGSVRLEVQLKGRRSCTVADHFTWQRAAEALRAAGVPVDDRRSLAGGAGTAAQPSRY